MNKEHRTGTLSELKAAAYYINNGYDLYWPMAAQSRCDFVAIKGSSTIKVQVKTITYVKIDTYTYKQCRLSSSNKWGSKYYCSDDFDEIVFIGEDCMYVIPFSEIEGKTSINFGNDNPNYKPRSKDYRGYEINYETH